MQTSLPEDEIYAFCCERKKKAAFVFFIILEIIVVYTIRIIFITSLLKSESIGLKS